jgi:molybdopterin-guanine dinucleotide biosynthesis protein A
VPGQTDLRGDLLKPRGYVLVGGRSERMGLDKATLRIAGRPLVEIAVATLRPVSSDVFLCGSRSDLAKYAPVLPDSREGTGPLMALVSALRHVSELGDAVLAVTLPVDVPLLPAELLQFLLERARESGAWATVPIAAERPQPLCAVFSAHLAGLLEALLQAGESKVMRALQQTCEPEGKLDLVDLAAILPPERAAALPVWFLNVNTPDQVAIVERELSRPRVW